MIRSLFGASSLSNMLRGGLEEASATHRVIADRVAGRSASSTPTGFTTEMEARAARAREEADLQQDMAALADTQLRFEADAKLLHETYARLRTAIHERA